MNIYQIYKDYLPPGTEFLAVNKKVPYEKIAFAIFEAKNVNRTNQYVMYIQKNNFFFSSFFV